MKYLNFCDGGRVIGVAFGILVIAGLLLVSTSIAQIPPPSGGGGGSGGGGINGSVAYGPFTWTALNFPAFWHENGISGETLSVLQPDLSTSRTIDKNNIYYNTTRQTIMYRVSEKTGLIVEHALGGLSGLVKDAEIGSDGLSNVTGGKNYAKIGWVGRPYVALNGKANKITELILEQNETESKTLSIGETWEMGNGYTLKLNSIDVSTLPLQAYMIISKDNLELDDKIVVQNQLYTFFKNIGGESNVPVFVTYFDNISESFVKLKYTWLISDNVTQINSGDVFGLMEVIDDGASSGTIVLRNAEQSIALSMNSITNLLDGLYLVVNDTPSLEYYPMMIGIIAPPGIPVESSTGKGTVYFKVEAGNLEDLTAVNISDIPEPPPGSVNLYYGLFRFNVTGMSNGSNVTLILTFPDNMPAGTTYWKYGANATNIMPHWYIIPSTINGNKLTITLTDGGDGDDDLAANGNISDDGGPSIPPAVLPVHNLNTSKNFSTIQAAIDDAETLNGHTITVDSGTYYESVNVTKQQLTLHGIGMPIVDAKGNGSAIKLSSNEINIEGFTATGAGSYPEAGIKVTSNNNTLTGNNVSSNNNYGIYLDSSSNNTLSRIIASNNPYGIWLVSSSNNTLTGIIASNNILGIGLYSSSNNTLSGNNARSNNNVGIGLYSSSSNNTLSGNNASNNNGGIGLYSSSNNTLSSNNASNNNYGIDLYSSSSNTLSGNNANSNTGVAIQLSYSSNNTLSGNNANSNNNFCILLEYSSNNTLIGNNVSNNGIGIYLSSSSNNTLSGNNANSNTAQGISMQSSSNNTLSGNNASNNNYGINLESSSNNTLSGNNASNNNYGIDLYSSSNNTIYDNYFSNTNNAVDYGNNIWNITKTAGKNIIGGPYLGGNFWANPGGIGFSQTCTDTDSDGICDSPYILDSNNIDYLPLAVPAAPPAGAPDIISFSPLTSTVMNNVGATRAFNIIINQTVDVSWQINGIEVFDETGVITSSYTKTSAAQGTWNVNAVANNANGTAIQTWVWIVTSVPTAGSISGFKINDTNGNGKWDANENGISNWTIRLIGITGKGKDTRVIRKETFTDDLGFYKFDNLPAGRYFVIENLKKGFVPTGSPVKRVKLAQNEISMNNNFTNRPIHSLDKINDKRGMDDYEVINRDIKRYIEDMD